jgi:hypothetical protein
MTALRTNNVPKAVPEATPTDTPARKTVPSAQKQKATTIGGTSVGVRMGQKYGGSFRSASKSTAPIAAKQDAMSSPTAARVTTTGTALTEATISRIPSSTHRTTISMLAKPFARALPMASLASRSARRGQQQSPNQQDQNAGNVLATMAARFLLGMVLFQRAQVGHCHYSTWINCVFRYADSGRCGCTG